MANLRELLVRSVQSVASLVVGFAWPPGGRVRVRVVRISQGFRAGQRERGPAYLGPVANLRELLVRSVQSGASLVVDCAWPPGGELGLGLLG